MTDLAEATIQRSLAVLSTELEALYGEPRGPGGERLTLGVVGMGKLGGRELNVSSDIDLIFVYEDDGETAGGTRSPLSTQEYFTRLGRRLIGVLSEATADGYVFRVDMRLRPNGDSGPLVCSLGMLEEYFYVQGREWERYAWIKGRLVSERGSEAARRLAGQLEAIVKPFVYRRYLDFGVIGAIRSLHQQIRQEAQRRASMRPDKADDIKLGRGGIREIEFSAQVFQLIRGGQDAEFRVRPTLAVLRHAQRARPDRGRGGRALRRGLSLPARARAPPAVPQRRADPRDAGRGRGSRGAGRLARFRRLRRADGRAGPAPRLRRGAVRPDLLEQAGGRSLRQRQWRGGRGGLGLERRAGRRRRGRGADRAPGRPRLRRSGRGAGAAARRVALLALRGPARKQPAALRPRRAARARRRARASTPRIATTRSCASSTCWRRSAGAAPISRC